MHPLSRGRGAGGELLSAVRGGQTMVDPGSCRSSDNEYVGSGGLCYLNAYFDMGIEINPNRTPGGGGQAGQRL